EERNRALAQQAGDAKLRDEVEQLGKKILALETQFGQVNSASWRPTRLQLAQALLTRDDPDWIHTLLHRRKMKVHVYHLDAAGRAVKLLDAQGDAGDVTDVSEPQQHTRALRAIGDLEADGHDSRLGSAVRQVLDHYR